MDNLNDHMSHSSNYSHEVGNKSDTLLCWGKKVSEKFISRIIEIGKNLEVSPNFLMACIAFETGGTFSASIESASGSGAVGLIQFMPSTAQALGTTTEKLASMGAVKQLDYVEKYFFPKKGKLKNIDDVYMAILWPAAIGKPKDSILFDRNDPKCPKRYIQNSGLDYNKDGKITKEEATEKVREYLELGLAAENAYACKKPNNRREFYG